MITKLESKLSFMVLSPRIIEFRSQESLSRSGVAATLAEGV